MSEAPLYLLHDSGGVQDAGSRLAPWAREDDPKEHLIRVHSNG